MRLKEVGSIDYRGSNGTQGAINRVVTFSNLQGEWHRLDGPAYMSANKYNSWWVNGNKQRDNVEEIM